jgi:hypothetical protein
MTTYDTEITITLTVGQSRDIILALHDAFEHNKTHGWFNLADEVMVLYNVVNAQVRAKLNEAYDAAEEKNSLPEH